MCGLCASIKNILQNGKKTHGNIQKQVFKETICDAISIGIDADTNACIAGSLAAILYGFSDDEHLMVSGRIDELMRDTLLVLEESVEKVRQNND